MNKYIVHTDQNNTRQQFHGSIRELLAPNGLFRAVSVYPTVALR